MDPSNFENDLPSVSSAMKNLIAVILAGDLTREQRCGEEEEDGRLITPKDLLAVARAFLAALNVFELAGGGEACSEESVCCGLMARVRGVEGAKVTQLFGRRMLEATKILTDGSGVFLMEVRGRAARALVPQKTVDVFLSTLTRSVSGSGSAEDDALKKLVWARDFNAALRERQLSRQAAVAERISSENSQEETAAAATTMEELPPRFGFAGLCEDSRYEHRVCDAPDSSVSGAVFANENWSKTTGMGVTLLDQIASVLEPLGESESGRHLSVMFIVAPPDGSPSFVSGIANGSVIHLPRLAVEYDVDVIVAFLKHPSAIDTEQVCFVQKSSQADLESVCRELRKLRLDG